MFEVRGSAPCGERDLSGKVAGQVQGKERAEALS